MPFTIIQARILCRASKNRGKVVPITENKFQKRKSERENIFPVENDKLRRDDYKMATTTYKISENGQKVAGIPDICEE